MTKDTRLTFRISAEIKIKLEQIAKTEGRSVAQIAEVFINVGLKEYARHGTSFIQAHVKQLQH